MIDPVTSLAFSIHNYKGAYALLLGSGVSRSAGIMTGWEITLDLIGQLAALVGEQPEPTPEAWYRAKYKKEPSYSNLLDGLTKTPDERRQLLRSYFEPTEEELTEGLKVPTAAHRAIAEMMRAGYVKVVVTTNFDRLLERAFEGLGVEPDVVSTADQAAGCLPLPHAERMILKVNGDYLGYESRNTEDELANYGESISALLDRIFDEFGLVVCGWSATSDIALRQALERCSSHRFGSFWCVRSDKPSGPINQLVNHRRATPVKIADADAFFVEIGEKIQALEDMSAAPHPLSGSSRLAD